MEETAFVMIMVAIYFGFVIADAASGTIHLRGGIAIARRDNPFGFWLVFCLAMLPGVLLLSSLLPDLTMAAAAVASQVCGTGCS